MNRHVVKKLRKLLCILASLALLAVPLSLVPAGRAAHAEVNPGPGETIHTSKAKVNKTFKEYNKFKKVSTEYRLLKWEITVTTPSEEDWNDLSYIDLVDDPETLQCHYLARRVELIDGTLLYSDSGFNREQSSNTGEFTDEGKKYFDTSLAEADKTQYPFDINNGCLKLRLKKDHLSPERDYTFVVYTHVTDDSKLSKRSFKNDVQVLTTFKDTLTVEKDEDTAESGVLKTTEKLGEPVGKGGEVEYTVTFDLGAYAKKLHMQNRTLYPNDKIVFYDEIKYGYLEYVPDSAVLSCDLFQNEYYKIPYTEFTGNLEVSTDGGKTTITYTMTDELLRLFDYTTGTFTYHGAQFNPILKINYLAKLTDEEARELTLSEEKENIYRNEVKVSYNGVVVGQDTEDVILTANKVLDKKYVHQGTQITYTVTVNPDAVKFNDDGSRLYAKDVAGANLRIIENSIKVSDENGELEIGSGKNQYDYKIEKDQNGDNVLKFNIPDGKALTITYSALIDVAGNIIQPTDRVANTFYLYKHEDVMEIDRVSNSIESGDFVQNSTLMIADIADQTYSGSEITPDVTVKDGNTTLVKDQDYTVSYSNNVNAAESTAENAPTVTITGIGAYYGTITKKFTINKADIPATAIHAPVGITDLTYNGSEQALVQRGSVEGNVGTVYYAVTDITATTAPTDGWTETVAKATYIGDYKVWYKVTGDANHNNVDAVALANTVRIAKSTATPKGLAGTLAAPYLSDKVGKVSLPEGWSWDDSDKDTALQVGVPVTKTAKYSGADQDNYEVEALTKEVTITRSACKHPKTKLVDKVTPTSDREGYSGDTYCLDCGVLVKKGDTEPKTFKPVTVNYVTHIQNVGWEKTAKKNGETSGTTGSSLRLEGIRIKVTGNENLGIRYTTHCQDYGWLAWSRDGEMSGTEGESKRLEAIMINLTGADKDKYDVYYRVHAQNVGWMNWAKNGEAAGTAGYGYRLEALQIEVVKKGEKPVNVGKITTNSTKNYEDKNKQAAPKVDGSEVPNVSYRTHVQNVGWQAWKVNGGFAGTSGRSLRLEGINIKLTNKDHTGGIRYKTHIQNLGWEKSWRTDGEMSGTSGRSLRLEAIDLELYGDMAEYYDIYYRVHAQDVGWMGWAANGADAGTAGYARRLEGIQVVLVPKGAAAPAANYGGITSVTAKPFLQR